MTKDEAQDIVDTVMFGEKAIEQNSDVNDLLSVYTMKQLGFTEKWPGGNPTEPWWVNPEGIGLEDAWFIQLPSLEEFWWAIAENYREQGRKEIRKLLNEALGR